MSENRNPAIRLGFIVDLGFYVHTQNDSKNKYLRLAS
jgi:hypothetical protein